MLPRHRPCAVAGCFAAAKLPAGLAAWDGWHGLIWQAVTHDALWTERLTQFRRLVLVLCWWWCSRYARLEQCLCLCLFLYTQQVVEDTK